MDHLDLERKEVLGLIEEPSEFVMRGTICPLEYPAEGSNQIEEMSQGILATEIGGPKFAS